MSWCPKCRTEYKEGVTVCAECGSELVDELPSLPPVSIARCIGEAAANRLADFLESEGISNINLVDGGPAPAENSQEDAGYELPQEKVQAKSSDNNADHVIEVFVSSDQKDRADKIVKVFFDAEGKKGYTNMSDDEKEKNLADELQKNEDESVSHIYTSAKEKYDDNKSSAWTFTVFGIAGIIFTLLNYLKILRLYSTTFQFAISGGMFILFIIAGILSFKRASEYKKLIGREADDNEKYTKWLKENITADNLAAVEDKTAASEANDLIKINYIKKLLSNEFTNINENLADTLAEKFYENFQS